MEVKYCSYCSGKLNSRGLLDIFVEGYVCEEGHKSHVIIKNVGQNSAANNNQFRMCGHTKPLDIIIAWLTKENMREYLHDQFGEFLMAHLDLLNGEKLNTIPLMYSWCPICGEKLQELPTDDLYVATLRCINGHIWNCRGALWQKELYPIYHIDITYEEYLRFYNFYMLDKRFEKHFAQELKKAVKKLKYEAP